MIQVLTCSARMLNALAASPTAKDVNNRIGLFLSEYSGRRVQRRYSGCHHLVDLIFQFLAFLLDQCPGAGLELFRQQDLVGLSRELEQSLQFDLLPVGNEASETSKHGLSL